MNTAEKQRDVQLKLVWTTRECFICSRLAFFSLTTSLVYSGWKYIMSPLYCHIGYLVSTYKHKSPTTSNPLTAEVNNIDCLVTVAFAMRWDIETASEQPFIEVNVLSRNNGRSVRI